MSKITEANAREVHAIEFLAGLDAQLNANEQNLKERLQSIPNGWRNYRLALKMTENVIDAVYDTLPEKTIRHMARLCAVGEVIIRPKPALTKGAYSQVVDNEDLRFLINRAMEGCCAICLKNPAESKGCAMRKVLMRIAPPETLRKDGICDYRDVAARCNMGEYI